MKYVAWTRKRNLINNGKMRERWLYQQASKQASVRICKRRAWAFVVDVVSSDIDVTVCIIVVVVATATFLLAIFFPY